MNTNNAIVRVGARSVYAYRAVWCGLMSALLESKAVKLALVLVAFVLAFSPSARAQGYGVATTDSNGVITFTPGVLIGALLAIAILIVSSIASLVLLYKATRMLFSWLKAR